MHDYLTARILSQPPEQIFISIITIEEILQGALASVQQAKQKSSVTEAYRYFEDLFSAFICAKSSLSNLAMFLTYTTWVQLAHF